MGVDHVHVGVGVRQLVVGVWVWVGVLVAMGVVGVWMMVRVLMMDDRMRVVRQVAVSLSWVWMKRRVGIDVVVRQLVTVLVVLVRVVLWLVRRRRRRGSRVLRVRRRRGVAVGQWTLVVPVSTGLGRRVVLALGRWAMSRR